MFTLFGKRIRLFRPKSIWLRKIVQWGFFILIALIAINHGLAKAAGQSRCWRTPACTPCARLAVS